MRKILCPMLSLCLLLSFVSMPVYAFGYSDSGSCGNGVTWDLSQDGNGTLTISGSGAMDDWDWDAKPEVIPPWAALGSYARDLIYLNVEDGVTHIGDDAFAGCRYLARAVISDTVTSIGNDAFYGCSTLWDLKLPAKIDSIDEYAFHNCTSLGSIALPDTLTHIGNDAFHDCGNLNVSLSRTMYNSIDVAAVFSGNTNATFDITEDGAPIQSETTDLSELDDGTEVQAVPVSGISLNCTTLNLNVGDNEALVATISPADATDKTIVWESSAPTVASVDSHTISASFSRSTSITVIDQSFSPRGANALVAAKSEGTAVITATTNDGGYIAECTVTVTADNQELAFSDVSLEDYYYDPVQWAVDYGITSGTSATTFSPHVSCSRAQMVTFLWRSAGEPEPSTIVNPFIDVKPSDYYYKAVLWAVDRKITSGTSVDTFSPDAICSRGQAVAFLYRMAGQPPVSCSNFSDVSTDSYYYDSVIWASNNGITSGTSATTFSPNESCTRGQIVTFLYRYLA